MSENIIWADIFDLFQEGMDKMDGVFMGNNDVEYHFNGKWDEKIQRWVLYFWVSYGGTNE